MNPVYDPTLTVPAHILEAARTIDCYFEEQGIRFWELQGICSRKRVWELEEEVRRAYSQPPVTLGLMSDDASQESEQRSWQACEDKIAESLFRLAHEIRDSRKTQESLLKFLQEHFESATKKDLEELGRKLMKTQEELASDLKLVLEQQKKTSGEIATVQGSVVLLNQKIEDLEAIIAAGGTIGQELIDAVAAVKDQAQVVDDQIPDVIPEGKAK